MKYSHPNWNNEQQLVAQWIELHEQKKLTLGDLEGKIKNLINTTVDDYTRSFCLEEIESRFKSLQEDPENYAYYLMPHSSGGLVMYFEDYEPEDETEDETE